MKIGIDISQSVYEGTGVARFTLNFVNTFANSAHAKDHNLFFFFSSLNHKLPGDIQEILNIYKNTHLISWLIPPRALSYLWGHENIRKMMPIPKNDLDIFISSDWSEPHPKVAQKKVTIVHDLIFKKYPDTVDPIIQQAQSIRLKHVTKESSLIMCDSISTKNDLQNFYPEVKAKLIVNYPGVRPVSANLPTNYKYSFLPKKYFLSVGKLEPRKNIPLLIDAYTNMIGNDDVSDFELVVVGPKGWDISENNLSRKGVHFLGKVTDEELALLYQNAIAFVYPTIYEGFGIPPLEAMHAGCPVILSNTSSLVEIADTNSALFINPNSKQEISDAMKKLATDSDLAKKLIKNGFENVKKYNWNSYIDNFVKEINSLNV